LAISSAIDLPMPLVEPVITATLSFKLNTLCPFHRLTPKIGKIGKLGTHPFSYSKREKGVRPQFPWQGTAQCTVGLKAA
jgi:hypothetical protein